MLAAFLSGGLAIVAVTGLVAISALALLLAEIRNNGEGED